MKIQLLKTSLLLLLATAIPLLSTAAQLGDRRSLDAVGPPWEGEGFEWVPVKDLNDPKVKEMATYAVRVHNKRSKDNLRLVAIKKAETYNTGYDVDYRMFISARGGPETTPSDYKTNVYHLIVPDSEKGFYYFVPM